LYPEFIILFKTVLPTLPFVELAPMIAMLLGLKKNEISLLAIFICEINCRLQRL